MSPLSPTQSPTVRAITAIIRHPLTAIVSFRLRRQPLIVKSRLWSLEKHHKCIASDISLLESSLHSDGWTRIHNRSPVPTGAQCQGNGWWTVGLGYGLDGQLWELWTRLSWWPDKACWSPLEWLIVLYISPANRYSF